MHIGMIAVVGGTDKVSARELDVQASLDVEEKHGIEHHQRGIGLVALHIVVQGIGIGKVFLLVPFPCIDMVVSHIERETAQARKVHTGVALEGIATAHIVVAVYHIVIIALGSAQQDGIEEYPLLDGRHIAYITETVDGTGPHTHRLGDAVWGEIIIKEGTKSLAAAAFLNCEKITKIILPDEIVNIGERTFCGCTNLKSIQLPASLEEIEYRAFKDCVQLQNIEIPHNVIEIEYETFKNCSSLKSVTLPQSLQNIGTYCFAWCDSLTKVDIPNNLKSIPDYLFFNCLQLKRVTLGEKVETIGFRAFSGCNSLSEVVALPALPPILYEDKIHLPEKVFSNYQNCNLFVPKGSSDLYKNASGWSEFANMYELADGGIDVPQNNEVYISLHNKTIQISGDVIGYIYLYAIDGKTMYIGNAKQIKLTRSGIYILKVNSKNYKILVK